MNHPKKHPLDPGIDTYCGMGGCLAGPPDHCHCDYHDGDHGCRWGNRALVRRLVASLGGAEENDWTPPILENKYTHKEPT